MTIAAIGADRQVGTAGWLDPLDKTTPMVACRTDLPDLWFSDKPDELERAKALCQTCPARLACLAGALERRESCGVWGGEIFVGGVVVARKRPRGRPRREDRAA